MTERGKFLRGGEAAAEAVAAGRLSHVSGERGTARARAVGRVRVGGPRLGGA